MTRKVSLEELDTDLQEVVIEQELHRVIDEWLDLAADDYGLVFYRTPSLPYLPPVNPFLVVEPTVEQYRRDNATTLFEALAHLVAVQNSIGIALSAGVYTDLTEIEIVTALESSDSMTEPGFYSGLLGALSDTSMLGIQGGIVLLNGANRVWDYLEETLKINRSAFIHKLHFATAAKSRSFRALLADQHGDEDILLFRVRPTEKASILSFGLMWAVAKIAFRIRAQGMSPTVALDQVAVDLMSDIDYPIKAWADLREVSYEAVRSNVKSESVNHDPSEREYAWN